VWRLQPGGADANARADLYPHASGGRSRAGDDCPYTSASTRRADACGAGGATDSDANTLAHSTDRYTAGADGYIYADAGAQPNSFHNAQPNADTRIAL
jgi:hypothetical protein